MTLNYTLYYIKSQHILILRTLRMFIISVYPLSVHYIQPSIHLYRGYKELKVVFTMYYYSINECRINIEFQIYSIITCK